MAHTAWPVAIDRTRTGFVETTRMAVEQTVLAAACSISAGIHGALVHDHLAEGAGPGAGFLVSTVLLIGLAAALTGRASQPLLAGSATVLAGLIAAYFFAVTTGLPFLHPEVEPVDGLALVTKAVEALGLLVALDLLRRPDFLLHERTTR
jgi:hypothetical protein